MRKMKSKEIEGERSRRLGFLLQRKKYKQYSIRKERERG